MTGFAVVESIVYRSAASVAPSRTEMFIGMNVLADCAPAVSASVSNENRNSCRIYDVLDAVHTIGFNVCRIKIFTIVLKVIVSKNIHYLIK